MARSVRNQLLLAKIEATYGVDSTPTGAANAMLITNVQANPLNAANADRNLLRGYFGASEQLIGVAFKEVSFEVELVGSGTAGTAPAWGPLLRACGMGETLTASTRVDYTPVSTALESVTMYLFVDGVRHVLLGARGEWGINAKVGDIPRLTFRFQGLDGSETAVSNPAATLTAWQTPQVVTDAFSPDFKLGGTVSPTGAPSIATGTDTASTGLTLQSGNALAFTNLIGLQEMDLTDRQVTGEIEVDLAAAAEVTRMAAVRANTLSSVSMLHGTVTGKKVLLHMPAVQFINPGYTDLNGRLLNKFGIRAVPVSGNDEVRIVTSF